MAMYLDDEEDSWRRVKGSVVESNDGGAISGKQVPHLHKTNKFQICSSNKMTSCIWFPVKEQLLLQNNHLNVRHKEQNSSHSDAG